MLGLLNIACSVIVLNSISHAYVYATTGELILKPQAIIPLIPAILYFTSCILLKDVNETK
ncbi:hypothetical protein [Siminovitchia fortis]|uniref:hypothetical protein n=1 Tax=Siminovitchia fortis TaxID=254758 RepID=UPI001643CB3E|nr:hypothetical protein [Siminovitchia fortis]